MVEVTALLESLIPLGLVSLPGNTAGGGVLKEEMKGEKRYRLRPFMVGWYEAGMRRLDKEFAELFEQFIIAGGGERVFAPRQWHVHLAFYGFTIFADAPQFMGTCNCCSCCCGVMHGPKLGGLDLSTEGPQKSNYRAVIDPEPCTACGACILRCPVDAIAEGPKRLPTGPLCVAVELEPGKSVVDRDACIGCGVCVIGCPTDAIAMEPVPEEEWFHVPSSMGGWEELRLQNLALADQES